MPYSLPKEKSPLDRLNDLGNLYNSARAENEERSGLWIKKYPQIVDYFKIVGNILENYNYFNSDVYFDYEKTEVTTISSLRIWTGNKAIGNKLESGFQILLTPVVNGYVKFIAYGFEYFDIEFDNGQRQKEPLYQTNLYDPKDLDKDLTLKILTDILYKITYESSIHFLK